LISSNCGLTTRACLGYFTSPVLGVDDPGGGQQRAATNL
jgi:hypothetical protein